MAYLEQEDPNLLNDINTRKEFAIYSNNNSKKSELIPRFLLKDIFETNNILKQHSYQKFVENFINPNTSYTRLLLQWSPGMGKTIASLSIALNFINYYYKEQSAGIENVGSVWIIGFTENIFKADLLKFPEFGFISLSEQSLMKKLKENARNGSMYDLERLNELKIRINKRFSNRQENGFFKFIGYKALLNRIFLIKDPSIILSDMNEMEIKKLLQEEKISLNMEIIKEMHNSLLICDEVHNLYNSAEKNNWGVAIQTILDYDPSIRALLLSATPFNNSPTEIIDLLNLLLPRNKFPFINKSDFFDKDQLIEEKIPQLYKYLSGRVSFITNSDFRLFPAKGFIGEKIPSISYLRFIRSPMSEFHYKTYKSAEIGQGLTIDSQYIADIALPNPEHLNAWQHTGIYKSSDIKTIYSDTSNEWRKKYNLHWDNKSNQLYGEIFDNEKGCLKTISAKYSKMVSDIIELIKNRSGKIFIFHNVIHMSGVLMIGEILRQNGFISENESGTENTLCSICGKRRKEHRKEQLISGGSNTDFKSIHCIKHIINDVAHNMCSYNKNDIKYRIIFNPIIHDEQEFVDYMKKNKIYVAMKENHLMTGQLSVKKSNYTPFYIYGFDLFEYDETLPEVINLLPNIIGGKKIDDDHTYMPCRFTLIHNEINKKAISTNIENYNSISNIWGDHIMILVGGKIMKESINLSAVQNLFIAFKPDNISTMIQIIGRAVRTNSHALLPQENRLVKISIYTHCLPDKSLSIEEEKYKLKIQDFKVIQLLEKILHEVAIDNNINYDLIFQPKSELQKKQEFQLDVLPYKKYEFKLTEINTSTFNTYYMRNEIKEIRFLIKKAFIEISPVWNYDDLLEAIKKLTTNFNTEYISENSYNFALNSLVFYDQNKFVSPDIENINKALTSDNLYHKLYDISEKYIFLADKKQYGIVQLADKFILLPYVASLEQFIMEPEMQYRMPEVKLSKEVEIRKYLLQTMNLNYDTKKYKFINKWQNIDIRNLELSLCDFGLNFHKTFLEECIEYIFNLWTDSSQKKSPHHIFYIKMLYYYDIRNIIIWCHTLSDKLYQNYAQWVVPTSTKLIKEIKETAIDKKYIESSSGLANLLKTTINKNDNYWLSTGMSNEYHEKVKISLAIFEKNGNKKKLSKIPADYLPVGHFLVKTPRFYNPKKGGWYEDINYLEDTSKYKENDIIIGYHSKSKTGIRVEFKIRNPIQNIKVFKDIRQIEKGTICHSKNKKYLKSIANKLGIKGDNKENVMVLCEKIRLNLTYREIKARSENSNIKWFYFLHEIKPETVLLSSNE